jgi:hypothetical protein
MDFSGRPFASLTTTKGDQMSKFDFEPEPGFLTRQVTPKMFEEALADAKEEIQKRPRLTEEERAAGWREDALSGVRFNIFTSEVDDSLFVHISPGAFYRKRRDDSTAA